MSIVGECAGFALMQVPSPIRQVLGGPGNQDVSWANTKARACWMGSVIGQATAVASLVGSVFIWLGAEAIGGPPAPPVFSGDLKIYAVLELLATVGTGLAVTAVALSLFLGSSALVIFGATCFLASRAFDYMKHASVDDITSKTWGYVPSELVWAKD